ncbi:MAG: hypothetical protein ACRDN0_20920 [Trebonia sp.]
MAVTTMSRPASAGELLQRRCHDLVAAEMARLSRRVPGLQAEHLREVEAALNRVTDRLVVSRARTVSADQLTELFAIAETP